MNALLKQLCSVQVNSISVYHSHYIIQSSSDDTCRENSVRLVGGHTVKEGRVQICHNGDWHSVCADSWSETEAATAASVLCLGLGYSGDSGKVFTDNHN